MKESEPILELQEPCIREFICMKTLLCLKDESYTAKGAIVKGQRLNLSTAHLFEEFYILSSIHLPQPPDLSSISWQISLGSLLLY